MNQSIFKKMIQFLKKRSSLSFFKVSKDEREEFNLSEDFSLLDINIRSYLTFRLNLVSLKFNLIQLNNKDILIKSRDCLDLGIELGKYLEFHKDRIVYSKEFFKSIEDVLNLVKVVLENQEYISDKSKEFENKTLELINELVNILSYQFNRIIDSDKDELISKLKVVEMDIKSYSSYINLKKEIDFNE